MRFLQALAAALLLTLWGCTSTQTPPITDANGAPLPGSVASLEQVQLGGVPQWILVRGDNAANPLLLKLHGGPGLAEMATRPFNRPLERDFVVVEWDQRGAGKSASAIEPASGMTLDQIVEDTHELTRLLLARFGQRQLILVGHSWGSVVGMMAIQKHPGDYAAFVSTGQIAHFAEGMRASHAFAVAEALRRQRPEVARALSRHGAPPYLGNDHAARRALYNDWLVEAGGVWHSAEPFDRVRWMLAASEYAWPEKLRFGGAAERSFERLMPQLARVDLARSVPRVAVPVYFAAGRFDQMAPTQVARTYFDALDAPEKHWVWFEQSAHFPQWEEAEAFHRLLAGRVLPDLRARSR